ncbi:MAG: zinc metalloprotease HtpX [Dehalococcoidales bacterium]
MNAMKTALLLAALTILLILVGQAIGGRSGAIFAFAIALAMNFGTYWFSDKIILKMYRARELSPEDGREITDIVRDLALRSGLPMPKVYVLPQASPNAFATGRSPSRAAVAVTSGITQILTKEKLTGVLGHELAHIKDRDILIGTIAATMAGAITMLAYMGRFAAIFGGFGRGDNEGGGGVFTFLLMAILAPIAALIIQLAVSRAREYEADLVGARIAGNPLYLANALRKLDSFSRRIPMKASQATAHMFIVNPLRGGGFASLFSTHPPIVERVKRLERMVGLA